MVNIIAGIYGTSALLALLVRAVLIDGQMLRAGLSLIISVVILVGFLKRSNWARWLISIGGGFGCLAGLITFFSLSGDPVGKLSLLGMILLVVSLADGAVCVLGLFSQQVNEEFGT
ncbi:MAG: hypothetical protein PF961_13370 [Planctomycetota bacterium]|jgi:uncharacterized membrane protein|nr:hypothetical protein [Planctomycetota bacterium]